MKKIEEVLNTFNLSKDFSESELEIMYKLNKKSLSIDFGSQKIDVDKQNEIEYDYQVLKIYSKLKKLIVGTSFWKDGNFNILDFNIFPEIDTFYKQSPNNIHLSHLFSLLKLDLTSFDISIENTTKIEIIKENYDNFMQMVKEDCVKFINSILEKKLGNRNTHFIESIILQDDFSIREVVIRVYRFAVGEDKLVTTKFKEKIEKFDHNSVEYRKGIAYFTQMYSAKTYYDAIEIYNIAKAEIFKEEDMKLNIKK